MATAVITGKDGAISLGGSAVNGKILEWELTSESKNVETDGMGDAWIPSVHIRNKWTVRGRAYALDQADWDLDQGLVGTEAVISLKRKSADTNPYFTDTGLLIRHRVTHNHEEGTEFEFEMQSSDSEAPTFDTTPAT